MDIYKQWNNIVDILGDKLKGDHVGGLYSIDLTYKELKKMLNQAPDFIWLDSCHNDAPCQKDLIDFLKNNRQFIAECYIIDPNERNDYRVEIAGIKAPYNDENCLILNKFICNVKGGYPDEYHRYDNMIRAWWD